MSGCQHRRFVPHHPPATAAFSAADRELLLGPSPSLAVILKASEIAEDEPEVCAALDAEPCHPVAWSPRLRLWVGIHMFGGCERVFRFGAAAEDLKWSPAFRPEDFSATWSER